MLGACSEDFPIRKISLTLELDETFTRVSSSDHRNMLASATTKSAPDPSTTITLESHQELMIRPVLLALAGLVTGFATPIHAQEKGSVDPKVRQQIEELNVKYDDAFNKNDAEGIATLFSVDAVETGAEGAVSGQSEIEDWYGVLCQSHPTNHISKLDRVYAIGNRVCAISEWSVMQKKHTSQPMFLSEGYVVMINVREADAWKIQTVLDLQVVGAGPAKSMV
jgi:uncharacterized protein (TIGR02246 family)